MKNWQDYVSIQNLTDDQITRCVVMGVPRDIAKCHYLIYKTNWKKSLSLVGDSDQFDFNDVLIETADTIGDKVEEAILTSFPTKVITNKFELRSAQSHVAMTTRRGVANTNWNNVWYYRGTVNPRVDQPIFVIKYNDRYGIWKHPLFENYGFVAVDN